MMSWLARRVYPRVCGGTVEQRDALLLHAGLSPRVRGNPHAATTWCASLGSIPACAGEPCRKASATWPARVYPRVCGGTRNIGVPIVGYAGLSPRVRGNLNRVFAGEIGRGSIPACAGEPGTDFENVLRFTVYPRVCGGTATPPVTCNDLPGLSPRVRGNRWSQTRRQRMPGSIPACAGEPCPPSCTESCTRVYPRVCGGTGGNGHPAPPPTGLSPRVRGNQGEVIGQRLTTRSIPACAGEPFGSGGLPPARWVYPRVCGGTNGGIPDAWLMQGLSPRVRGNQMTYLARNQALGSIPACAGEPAALSAQRAKSWVYPRVCGGTASFTMIAIIYSGLSPRVRGNPAAAAAAAAVPSGSIPACAGEPNGIAASGVACGVYPRVCGGTIFGIPDAALAEGLSPRVRGNPDHHACANPRRRSIPACAGEPPRAFDAGVYAEVYPRVCGGTPRCCLLLPACVGLSPRVRGNLALTRRTPSGYRSIPACAGEPLNSLPYVRA